MIPVATEGLSKIGHRFSQMNTEDKKILTEIIPYFWIFVNSAAG